jgi:hypothetical protein
MKTNTLEMYMKMMKNKKIDMSIFSDAGYNECPVDGKLTLSQYVKDCNDWWFDLAEQINNIDILYSENKKSGAVVYEVIYRGNFKLPVAQYMKLDNEGKIITLTSYWNVERVREASKTNKALEVLFPENRLS